MKNRKRHLNQDSDVSDMMDAETDEIMNLSNDFFDGRMESRITRRITDEQRSEILRTMRVYSPEELIEHAEHIDSTIDSLVEELADMAETDDSKAKAEIRREMDLNESLLELFVERLAEVGSYDPMPDIREIYKVSVEKVRTPGEDIPYMWLVYNLPVKKGAYEFAYTDGVAKLLRMHLNLPDEMNPWEYLGGKYASHLAPKGASSKKDAWAFRSNPFERTDVQRWLGMFDSRNLDRFLEMKFGGTEIEAGIASFDARQVLAAPNPADFELETHILPILEGAKQTEPDNPSFAMNQKEEIARTLRSYLTGKPTWILVLPPGSGKTFVVGGFIKSLIGYSKNNSINWVIDNLTGKEDLDADRTDPEKLAKLNFLILVPDTVLQSQIARDLNGILPEEIRVGRLFQKMMKAGHGVKEIDGKIHRAQIKEHSVRIMTYASMYNQVPGDAWKDPGNLEVALHGVVDENTMVIFDESAKLITNIEKDYHKSAYLLAKRSHWQMYMSGTPWKNPAHAYYLAMSGAFDWHSEGFSGIAKGLHLRVRKPKDRLIARTPESERWKQAKMPSEYADHPSLVNKYDWMPNTLRYPLQETVKFLASMIENGVYFSRPNEMMANADVAMDKVSISQDFRDLIDRVSYIYSSAIISAGEYGVRFGTLKAQKINAIRRVLERAKIGPMADMVAADFKSSDNSKIIVMVDNRSASKMGMHPPRQGFGQKAAGSEMWFLEEQIEKMFEDMGISRQNFKKQRFPAEFIVDYFRQLEERVRANPGQIPGDIALADPSSNHRKFDFDRTLFSAETLALAESFVKNKEYIDEIAQRVFSKRRDKAKGTLAFEVPGSAQDMKKELLKRGLPERKVAVFHGGVDSAVRAKMLNDFNAKNDDVRVMVSTVEAGSTGLSWHDVYGDFPRDMYIASLPWSFLTGQQLVGRVARVGMKSQPAIHMIEAEDVLIEELFATRLTKGMRGMGLSAFCGLSQSSRVLSGSMKERDDSGATAR